MSTLRAERWSDLECASGSRLGVLTVIGGSEKLALDDSEELTLTVAADTVGLALGVREVVRIVDGSTIREWRVAQIEDSSTDPTVRVTAEPVIVDLATAGFLRSTTSGGKTYHSLGGQKLTAGQFADTFVLANLTEDGLSWLAAGTYEPSALMTLAWDRWTRTQLLQAIVEQTRAEVRLRRNGSTGYYLDILNPDSTGASATKVLLRVGRNLSGLNRTRSANDYASVIVPVGWTVNGAAEPASLEYAAWKITAKGTNTLTLADPAGGDGPIAFDDQLNGAYAVSPADATLVAVTDTVEATQQIVLADATGFTVGDHVEFRADSAGTHITGLSDPAELAGRSVKTIDAVGVRGERQFVPKPWPEDWTTAPEVLEGIQNGADANPVGVTGLPAGTAIAVGDRIESVDGYCIARVTTSVTVTATGTTMISYQALVTTTSTVAWENGASSRLRLVRLNGRRPVGWGTDSGMLRRLASVYGTLTCAVGATIVVATNTSSRVLSLKSLTTGTVLQPGDYLYSASTVVFAVKEGATSTATTASVLTQIKPVGFGTVSLTVGDPLTLYRPYIDALHNPYNDYVAVLPVNETITIPCPSVRYDGSESSLWASVGYHYYSREALDLSVGTTPDLPYLYVLAADGTTVLSSMQASTTILQAFVAQACVLRLEHTLTETIKPYVKFAAPHATLAATTSGWEMQTLVRWITLTIGPDPQVPVVAGSHGNKLWQMANLRLVKSRTVPSVFRVSLVDLSRMAGYEVTTESLVLGGTVVLVDTPLGIDTEARIVSVTMNPARPEEASIVLDTTSQRFTSRLQRTRGRSAVNIGTQIVPSYKTSPLDTMPGSAPFNIEDTLRAYPSGDQQGALSGAIDLIEWTPTLL